MTDCKMDCEGRIKVAVISAAKPDEVAKSYQDYFGYQKFLTIVFQCLHADFHCCWVFFLACICKQGTLFDAKFLISPPPQWKTVLHPLKSYF